MIFRQQKKKRKKIKVKLHVINIEGETTDDIEISDKIFSLEPNKPEG